MAEAKGYETNKWAGKSNYECKTCEFSTLNEEEMKKHVQFHKSLPQTEETKTDGGGK